MNSKLSIFTAILVCTAMQAVAVEDELFSEPPKGGLVQVILGLSDLALSDYISGIRKGGPIDPRVIALNDANNAVKRANALMTQEAKTAKMGELEKLLEQAKGVADNLDSDRIDNIVGEIQELAGKSAVTSEAKQAAVSAAEKGLADARAVMLNSTKAIKGPGLLSKSIRTVRVIGGSVFILDVLGRIYVWHALDRNPGFFPAGKVMAHYGAKVYGQLRDDGFFADLYGSRESAEKTGTRH